MDTGLLILRVVFGGLIIGHGVQKLFGWWGGHGLDVTGGFFHSMGFRPGRRMAAVAGLSEVGGGWLLALGFLVPLSGAVIVGTLVVAASVQLDNGLWAINGGPELAVLYAVAAAAVAVAGPGAVSLDHFVGLDERWSTGLGLAAVGVGVVAGVAVAAQARRTVHRGVQGVAATP